MWGLQPHLAEAVALKCPTTIAQAAGHAEEIELAKKASHRPNLGVQVARPTRQFNGRGGSQSAPQHLLKVEVEKTLVYTNKEDEDMEDVVVADGTVDVKVEAQPLRPELAHSVLTVVSMDITLHNVQELQVHQAVVVLHNL